MGFDKVKIKQISLMILYIALVILVLIYSEQVFAGIGFVFSIMMPFIVGGVIAFILNIPMNMIEKKWLKKWNGKLAEKLKRPVSMILAILLVILVLSLVVLAVVPQLKTTITTIGAKAPAFFAGVMVQLEKLFADQPMLLEQLQKLEEIELDWNSITTSVGGFLKTGVSNVLTSTVSVASSIVGGIANGFISFVFSIYILSQKENLESQGRRILKAYLPEKVNRYVTEVFHRLYVNFTSFICGQCLEAVILGLMFVVAMSIFGMPYAVMVGTLIAFTALIPIVGAFIGCAVGAFMILIENPVMALWFLILFLILQQVEGNLIYPRVVGNSVGLPSIWVLMAVSVGGSLLGVAGMLVFIPLMSTLYSLLRDDVNRRNATKDPKPQKRPRKRYHKPQKQELNEKNK
ncbi:MAG: AI-2E family transporter [Lachnospiraceae bacterium]|nr:AI-2E family transporter [Lachnospiraceae bacterium]